MRKEIEKKGSPTSNITSKVIRLQFRNKTCAVTSELNTVGDKNSTFLLCVKTTGFRISSQNPFFLPFAYTSLKQINYQILISNFRFKR
jgi:hypothetical protein